MSSWKPISIYSWISREPRILRHHVQPDKPGRAITRFLSPKPTYRLFTYPWAYGLGQVIKNHEWERRQRPQDTLIHLFNELSIYEQARAYGYRCEFISANAFIDDTIFVPKDTVPKWDAIYVARMNPQKRLDLAKKVPNLVFVGSCSFRTDSQDYWKRIQKKYPQAEFYNAESGRWLELEEVSDVISQAQVGLMLSEKEGACKASLEYQLCGLPVVSTVSQGGRHVFYEPRTAKVVLAQPEKIAQAVKHFLVDMPTRQEVRQDVMKIVTEHRERFCDLVQGILDREGCSHRNYRREFYQTKLKYWPVWKKFQDPDVEEKPDGDASQAS